MGIARNIARLIPNGSGKLPVTNLADSGTPSSSTFLRGDNAWGSVVQKVVQIQQMVTTTTVSTTSSSFVDTGITLSITPTSASNRIILLSGYNIYLANNGSGRDEAQGNTRVLRAGSTQIATTRLQAGVTSFGNAKRHEWGLSYVVYDQPATTSSVEYKVQMNTAGFETIIAQQGNSTGYLILIEVTA